MSTKVGGNIGILFTNIIFAYADDIVLLAPSLADCVFNIDMLCSVEKTVCMVFPHMDRRKAVMSISMLQTK